MKEYWIKFEDTLGNPKYKHVYGESEEHAEEKVISYSTNENINIKDIIETESDNEIAKDKKRIRARYEKMNCRHYEERYQTIRNFEELLPDAIEKIRELRSKLPKKYLRYFNVINIYYLPKNSKENIGYTEMIISFSISGRAYLQFLVRRKCEKEGNKKKHIVKCVPNNKITEEILLIQDELENENIGRVLATGMETLNKEYIDELVNMLEKRTGTKMHKTTKLKREDW